MVFIECEPACLVCFENPRAFRGSEVIYALLRGLLAGGIDARSVLDSPKGPWFLFSLIEVANAEGALLSELPIRGGKGCWFRVDLLADKVDKRVLGCIGNACCGGAARGNSYACVRCGSKAIRSRFFANGVRACGQQRALGRFPVGPVVSWATRDPSWLYTPTRPPPANSSGCLR